MNHHSDFHRLSPEQQVSLDKHQQMINSALMWQKHDRHSIEHLYKITADQAEAATRQSPAFSLANVPSTR
jgi:hypothetical protein